MKRKSFKKKTKAEFKIESKTIKLVLILSILFITLSLVVIKSYQIEKLRRKSLQINDPQEKKEVKLIEKKLPKSFPDDFPLVPNAYLLNYWSVDSETLGGMSLIWESKEDYEEIGKYYKLKLLDQGWSTSLIQEEEGRTKLMFEKDDTLGYLEVSESESGVLISVTIGIKKDDLN